MRANSVTLAVLAGLGLACFGAAAAEAQNLSCISGVSPGEQRLLRDCERKPHHPHIVLFAEEPPPPPPPPPLPPIFIKNGESGKGSGARGRDQDHDAPTGGGDPGPSL